MNIKPDVMLRVDRAKRLREQPGAGHNRWHPEIPPRVRVEPGQVVGIETIDAMDGEVAPGMTAAEMARCSPEVVHPLTGPIYVNGAAAGDLLEVEILEIVPETRGYTLFEPGFGYLRQEFGESSFLVHWKLDGGFATSGESPGVKIPACCHMGVMGVAPSAELLRAVNERERAWAAAGATVCLPEVAGAMAGDRRMASEAWRTISPHEVGGNLDIKQLGRGSDAAVAGVCGGGVVFDGGCTCRGMARSAGRRWKWGRRVYVRFGLRKGRAREGNIRDVQVYREVNEAGGLRRTFATTGQSYERTGRAGRRRI